MPPKRKATAPAAKPPAKRPRAPPKPALKDVSEATPRRERLSMPGYTETSSSSSSSSSPPPSDEEEEDEWEDVLPLPPSAPPPSGDLELTLAPSPSSTSTPRKKGASLNERRTRMLTHCLHVQFLLFHGYVRNRFLSDAEVQATMLSHVPAGVMRDVERVHTEAGMNAVLGTLLHWWRKKFAITAPGLRKGGYKTLQQFAREAREEGGFRFMTGNKGRDGEDGFTVYREAGETVRGREGLRECARACTGSRDVGAQLFTALCRALGWEARCVFSLQPLGYGFTGVETAREEPVKVDEEKDSAKKGKGKGKGKQVDSDSSGLSSFEDSESDSEGGGGFIKSKPKKSTKQKPTTYDKDLLYPIFWTELFSPYTNTYLTLSAFPSPLLGHTPELTSKFEPRGKKAADAKQIIAYVIAYSPDGTARDVTARYLSKRLFPGKTKGFRVPISTVPIYSYDGKIVSSYTVDWFSSALRPYQKPRDRWTAAEQAEDAELHQPTSEEPKKAANTNSISGYKNHPEYILSRHLKREEAIRPGKSHIKLFTTGKGPNRTEEKVFLRSDVVACKTAENWYREGRTIKLGEQPLKLVKRRAVTLTRKREIEEKQREGETAMQGLYSLEQTELYTPPPIVDGVIPTNTFGNMDVYVPSMIPAGAVHLPLKGAGKIAKKLGVSYADAVTGFEFRQQRAVPFVEGVIVARENEGVVRDAWVAAERERKRREEGKREADALGRWRRFLLKARVLQRLRMEWGMNEGEEEEVNPFARREAGGESGEGGGFLPDAEEEDTEVGGGGFLLEDEDEQPAAETGGGFILDIEDEDRTASSALPAASRDVMSLRDMVESTSNNNPFPSSSDESEEVKSPYFSKSTTPKPKTSLSLAARKTRGKKAAVPPPPPPNVDSDAYTRRLRRKAAETARRESKRLVSKYFDNNEDE